VRKHRRRRPHYNSEVRKVLAAAALIGASIACGREPARSGVAGHGPHILLVTVDTLRADRVGIGIAPTLDALARRGLWYTNARAAVPLTLPSHATILTGLLPPVHGVRTNGAGTLEVRHQTLATILHDRGYQAAAFVGAFVLDRRFGLARGFDLYDDRIPRDPNAADRLEAERPAEAVAGAALAWLDQRLPRRSPTVEATAAASERRPVFVWIHLYDPHAPYAPPPQFIRSAAATVEERYNAEIAYADSQIARILTFFKDRGQLDDTVVIVAGDHGEGLGEHGENTHGMLLYDSTLRVPLLIAGPGTVRRSVSEAVSLADIAPTVLRAATIAVPKEMSGRDLLAASASAAEAYAETEYPRAAGWSSLQALTDGRWKLIRAGASIEIYDLGNDPREQHDVAATQPGVAAGMAARVDVIHSSSTGSASRRAISPEAEERLRALGYVASSSTATSEQPGLNPARVIGDWNTFEHALTTLSRRPAEAVPILERLAERHPDALLFRSTYARALKDSGRSAAALEVYRRAAKRWPTDSVLLHDLAVAAREAGRHDEARRAELAAIAIDPDRAVAQNGLGLIAIDEGRSGDAVAAFSRATALDPRNGPYWVNLGNARRAAGDRQGAEQAYAAALDVDADNADAANGRGVLLVEAGRPAEAMKWFERALEIQPDFVEARLNLGIALRESGNRAGAEAAFRTVLAAAGGHDREKEAARRLLAALRSTR
jgi:choline-sulfatase